MKWMVYPMHNKNFTIFFIISAVLLIVISLSTLIQQSRTVKPPTANVSGWEYGYQQNLADNKISQDYLASTEYFDYTDPYIEEIAATIKNSSKSPEEAVQKTLDYVYGKLQYNMYEPDGVCLQGKASQIIRGNSAQCDTDTMVVVSLLRAEGIATRSVGGCVYVSQTCQNAFSINGEPNRLPKYKPATKGQIGRAGGLHAWAEAWLPNEGWVTLETTAGTIVRNTCAQYNVEEYPTNQKDLCQTSSFSYADWCANWKGN